MLFGETIKQYLNYVIAGASILLIIFFVVLYKKRHSLINKEQKNIQELQKKDNNDIQTTEQKICQ